MGGSSSKEKEVAEMAATQEKLVLKKMRTSKGREVC